MFTRSQKVPRRGFPQTSERSTIILITFSFKRKESIFTKTVSVTLGNHFRGTSVSKVEMRSISRCCCCCCARISVPRDVQVRVGGHNGTPLRHSLSSPRRRCPLFSFCFIFSLNFRLLTPLAQSHCRGVHYGPIKSGLAYFIGYLSFSFLSTFCHVYTSVAGSSEITLSVILLARRIVS